MKREERFLKSWFLNFKSIDVFFIQLTLALMLLGLIFAFSSSTYESSRLTNSFWTLGIKQFFAFIIGTVLLLLFSKINYNFWFKHTWLIACITSLLMIVTVFSHIGKSSGGSQRWLSLGFIQLQPAEITKFAVVLLLSRFLTKYKWFEFKKYYSIVFVLVLILIVFKQPDLGSSLILGMLLLQLFFLFGYPIWLLLGSSTLGIYLINLKMTSYQMDRITYWLHPYLEPQGRGYNLIQAKYALAFGGVFGCGLGHSRQKAGRLPIPHADFIVAIIAEEIGFVGFSAILVLYLTWILRGIYLVNKAENDYGKILGTAIILLISTQAIVNIAVAIGLLPITGVTLPFFSCGGTSLIVTLAMCGVLFNIISNFSHQKKDF